MSESGDLNSWRDIRDEAMRRISERIWRPGDLIPSEMELAEEFGCARATVNRALRDLADAGFVVRKRKAGTRVSINPVLRATLKIPILREEIEARGETYRCAVLDCARGSPPSPVRHRMGLAPEAAALHVRSVHLADGRPYAYEDRWINLDAAPGAEEEDFAEISANEWLVRFTPYTQGDIAISAAGANAAEAEHLGLRLGEAVMRIDRLTWNGPLSVTTVRLSYPPGYQIKTEI